eukprot:RCo054762
MSWCLNWLSCQNDVLTSHVIMRAHPFAHLVLFRKSKRKKERNSNPNPKISFTSTFGKKEDSPFLCSCSNVNIPRARFFCQRLPFSVSCHLPQALHSVLSLCSACTPPPHGLLLLFSLPFLTYCLVPCTLSCTLYLVLFPLRAVEVLLPCLLGGLRFCFGRPTAGASLFASFFLPSSPLLSPKQQSC